MINYEEGIFTAYYVDEFKNMMSKYNLEYALSLATDEIIRHIKEYLAELNDEEFKQYIRYLLSICERLDLQGWSNHMLFIGKKL